MSEAPKTKCPHCSAEDTWKPENAFRPFCSERCKLIDFGAWADESYQVPGESINIPDIDESAND